MSVDDGDFSDEHKCDGWSCNGKVQWFDFFKFYATSFKIQRSEGRTVASMTFICKSRSQRVHRRPILKNIFQENSRKFPKQIGSAAHSCQFILRSCVHCSRLLTSSWLRCVTDVSSLDLGRCSIDWNHMMIRSSSNYTLWFSRRNGRYFLHPLTTAFCCFQVSEKFQDMALLKVNVWKLQLLQFSIYRLSPVLLSETSTDQWLSEDQVTGKLCACIVHRSENTNTMGWHV